MQKHRQHFSYADTDNILYAESTNQPDFNTGKVSYSKQGLGGRLGICSNYVSWSPWWSPTNAFLCWLHCSLLPLPQDPHRKLPACYTSQSLGSLKHKFRCPVGIPSHQECPRAGALVSAPRSRAGGEVAASHPARLQLGAGPDHQQKWSQAKRSDQNLALC